jgi:hypothetical protein
MRIHDLFEGIDQKEADDVLRSLVATGDSVTARYFMQTRYDPRHTSIDSAQRAAERMAKKEQERSTGSSKPVATQPTKAQPTAPATKAKQDVPRDKDIDRTADKDEFKFDPNFLKNFKPFSGFAKAYKMGSALASKLS